MQKLFLSLSAGDSRDQTVQKKSEDKLLSCFLAYNLNSEEYMGASACGAPDNLPKDR